jgi:hypothetical protein
MIKSGVNLEDPPARTLRLLWFSLDDRMLRLPGLPHIGLQNAKELVAAALRIIASMAIQMAFYNTRNLVY